MDTLPWIYRLDCPVQYYDWGYTSQDGIIRSFLGMSPDIEPGKPHAELWMGAHPSAPSKILPEKKSLLDAVNEKPEHMLGPLLYSRGERKLPFLFKILDVARALSIQAHPDKMLAEQLHTKDSINYPDNNHKPELAVCIRDMKILAGFRSWKEIQIFLEKVPELAKLCLKNISSTEDEKQLIRNAWNSLMSASKDTIREAVLSYKERFYSSRDREEKIVFELMDYYGDEDPGIFCVYLLNYIELKKGEGIFLGPNEPHAYLGGQMLECMASSDNVVRAGLTNKYRDVQTLLSMLHYNSGPLEIIRPGPALTQGLYPYHVPVSDFILNQLYLTPGNAFQMHSTRFPSILLVFEGAVKIQCEDQTVTADQGSVLFFPGDLESRKKKIYIKTLETNTAEHYIATTGENHLSKP